MNLEKLPQIFSNVKTETEGDLIYDFVFTDVEPQKIFDKKLGIYRKSIDVMIDNKEKYLRILNFLNARCFAMPITEPIERFIQGCEFIGINLKRVNPLDYVTKEGDRKSEIVHIIEKFQTK